VGTVEQFIYSEYLVFQSVKLEHAKSDNAKKQSGWHLVLVKNGGSAGWNQNIFDPSISPPLFNVLICCNYVINIVDCVDSPLLQPLVRTSSTETFPHKLRSRSS
jgi:hypothetical protein